MDRRIDVEWLLAQDAWMRSLARGLLGDHGRAEDVVQEVYAAALARRPGAGDPEPDGRRGARAWLAAVVGNLARRARGREAARPAVEQRGARAEAVTSADELVQRMELQRALAAAVLALEEPYKSAVLWRHVEGASAAEIARRQGCTSEAARQRVSRGLARLRADLDGRFGERGAWAFALAPLATSAPVLAPLVALGGFAMGSKLIALALAGISALVLALVFVGERGPARTPAGTTRDDGPDERVAAARTELAPVRDESRERHAAAETEPLAADGPGLAGRVHDLAGRPIARANLVLAADESEAAAVIEHEARDPRWVVSDEDGAFRFGPEAARDAGRRTLWVRHADFLPASVELRGSGPLDVLMHALPAVEVVLRPPAGLLLDGPTEAHLWVRHEDGTEEKLGVDRDAAGRLIARGLPLGRLERVEGRQRGAGRGEKALELALRLDGVERVEVELWRGATVHGVVLDAHTSRPIPGADVWAEGWRSDDSPSPATVADEHGRFELVGVDPEDASGAADVVWCLIASEADGYIGQAFEAHSWPRNEAQRYEVELRLVPATARFEGRVVFPDARGMPARVWAVDGRAQFSFRLSDGSFTLDALGPGRLDLFLLTAEDAPFEARAGLRASFELAEGETRGAELRLAPGDAVLRGRLLDVQDRPVSGAHLTLSLNMVTERIAFGTSESEAVTDAAGRFEFPAEFAGPHQLEVRSLPDGLTSGPFEADLDLASGETRTFDLRCAPPIELAGHVDLTGPDGTVLDPARLRVLARAAADGAELAESIVAADGAFRFPRLYPTEIELVLVHDEAELGRTKAGPEGADDLVLVVGN